LEILGQMDKICAKPNLPFCGVGMLGLFELSDLEHVHISSETAWLASNIVLSSLAVANA